MTSLRAHKVLVTSRRAQYYYYYSYYQEKNERILRDSRLAVSKWKKLSKKGKKANKKWCEFLTDDE